MVRKDEEGMWNLVMFDLPVKTALQRRRANGFRHLLKDLGWEMAQYSVYVRYLPTGMSLAPEIRVLRAEVPPQGRVQILAISDRQWSKAIRFINSVESKLDPHPELLTLF